MSALLNRQLGRRATPASGVEKTPLFVTTTKEPPPALLARALAAAERIGVAYIRRGTGNISRMRRDRGGRLAYVSGRTRDVVMGDDEALFVNPGLFYLKRDAGPRHPLLRAVAPAAGPTVHSLIDGTLGLAGDALHLGWGLNRLLAPASAFGDEAISVAKSSEAREAIEIIGIEGSPVIASLLREGLPRMAASARGFGPAAGRIQLIEGQATQVLAAMAPNSAQVVYLDPMFDSPTRAAPGFDLLRQFAVHAPLDQGLLDAAYRVARDRVVVKLRGKAPAPPVTVGPGWNRRVRGRAVDFIICEKALSGDALDYDIPSVAQWVPREDL